MKKIILFLLLTGIAQPQNFWEQTNGPFGGSAFGIVENDLNELLVGTGIDGSRVYRSTDGGDTWIKSDSGMGYLEPEEILMNSDGYLFTNGYGSGTYRSTTNGVTWEELPGLVGYSQTSCLYIKENDNIYVGISDHPPYRIVKSTDDGETWIDISGNLINQVEAITSIADTLYIGTFGLGFFKSTDDGETWIDMSAYNNSLITGLTKNSSGELFASVEADAVLKSTDGGFSWVDICPEIFGCHTILPDVEGYFYVAGNYEIKRSSDGGNSWVNIYNGIHSFAGESFYIAESGAFYFSTYDAGIFRSNDQGESWKQVGFNNSYIYDIAVDELDNAYVTTRNNVYKSTNYGNSWIFSGNGMINNTEKIHFTNNGYLWTGCNWASVHRLYFSSDRGENWNPVQMNGVSAIDDNSFNDLFIAAGDGLYFSSNNGSSWVLKQNGVGGDVFIDDSDDIYYGHNIPLVSTDILELSSDNGETWTTLLTDVYIDNIYVDKQGNIFVGNEHDNYGLLRSTDSGISWDTVSHNFVGDRIYAITGNSTDQLFCSAGKYGEWEVYMSDDNGDNWSIVTSGIPSNTIVLSLDFDSRGFIYAGTTYNSVFRSLSTTLDMNEGSSDIPSDYSLYQNFPNPFNPNTIISYQIPVGGDVTLNVYDLLGREVATLVDEYKPAGKYEVEFDASSHSGNVRNLTSGIYFYTLRAGNFVQTKKMLLIK
jgi:photosystem II stability/assembly factor-like uncharacterized protein